MATTGELLVDMSTLTTGTALDHFLNIQFGGSGPCPDPIPCPDCPDCPDINDCPDPVPCPDCPDILDGPKQEPGVYYAQVHEGDIIVVEDININVQVLDNHLEFSVTNVDEEMDIILNIVPNTIKIDLEWL